MSVASFAVFAFVFFFAVNIRLYFSFSSSFFIAISACAFAVCSAWCATSDGVIILNNPELEKESPSKGIYLS
ncbi:MAG: hypothetical protein MZV64_27145 [Ignavibacteriales bacterium]|nr:hypothetical protein [Ignavibacteriales bacterium]